MANRSSTFRLIPRNPNAHYRSVNVDFSPVFLGYFGSKSITPTCNKDGNYYTPLFINPYQRYLDSRSLGSLENVVQRQKEVFNKKIYENQCEVSKSAVKYAPGDLKFCSVCYNHFDQYWQHVKSRTHQMQIRSSQANQYIHKLCEVYTKKKTIKKKPIKKKPMKNSDHDKKKQNKKSKTPTQIINYNPEDFIVKLPLKLFDKQRPKDNNNINASTMIMNSDAKI